MASEYLRWKYRDVKPDPEIEYSRAQKRQIWWDYHWKTLLVCLAAAVAGGFLIRDIFFRQSPDYSVALITKTHMSSEVCDALADRLAELGEDVNGDGKVLVEIAPYEADMSQLPSGGEERLPEDTEFPEQPIAGFTRLTVDLSSDKMYIVLTDDPEGLQSVMGILSFLDGSSPREEEDNGAPRWREMVYAWPGCPVLASLDLGDYTPYFDNSSIRINGQRAMDGLYIGRRRVEGQEAMEPFAADQRLFEALTAGAQPLRQDQA